MTIELIRPDWPAPPRVQTLVTTRTGGVSAAPYASLNLASHVGDDPNSVQRNRTLLREYLPADPLWLEQVHGRTVVQASDARLLPMADASFTRQSGTVCAVMTADCLPVLFCDRDATVVAAAHAGWRGLANGVLEATVGAMNCEVRELMVWLGPAIGPDAFEVGEDVYRTFTDLHGDAAPAFKRRGEKWLTDIYALARLRLEQIGLTQIYGSGYCTFQDHERFFSYRRDGVTGRMASLIWLADSES